MREIDEDFIRRIYRSSVYLWAVGFLFCLVLMKFWAAFGWTVGAFLSIGILWSLEYIVKKSFVPGYGEARKDLTKFSVLKLPIIIAILAAVVLFAKYFVDNKFEFIGSFCAGLILVQAVIVLKTLGRMISRKTNIQE